MGLLDLLSSDEAALGLGLLAAGGPTTDPNRAGFGQRMAAGVQYAQGNADNRLRRQFQQSQIDENKAQSDMQRQKLAMSQRQMDMDAQFLGLPPGPSVATAASAQPALAAASPSGGGAIPERAAGLPKAVEAFAQGTPATFGGVALTAAQISQKYGIPVEAIINDYRSNGGKKIAEFIMSKGTPDMQVSNGYAYDKNALKPGFLPSLTTSTSGQTSMTQIQDGQPVVSAPRGALDTYAAYQAASNRSAADYKPQEVIGSDGRKIVVPTSQVLQPPAGGAGNVQSPGYAGGDRNAANLESIRIIESEMQKPGNSQADVAAMKREVGRLKLQSGITNAQLASAPAGNVVELSPAEQAANEAARVRAVDTAKADVARDTGRVADAKKTSQMREAASTAMKILEGNPTGSGVGAFADAVGNFVGQPMKGASDAQQLEALGGWMTANVPRMEGPQSDADVRNYATMAGRIGDRTLPVSVRRDALKVVMGLMDKYADLNGAAAADSPKAAPKLIDALPTPNGSNKGQRIRDTTTGKILRSNGMQWKEE